MAGKTDTVTKGAKAKAKAAFKRKQTEKERGRAASGKYSAKTTQAGDKPLSMGAYRSFTSTERVRAITKAKADYRNGKISEEQRDNIINKIKEAEQKEALASRLKRTGKRTSEGVSLKDPLPPLKSEKVSKPKEPAPTFKEKERLKKILKEQESKAKKKMMRGGMMKSGHMDMRKGGLFYK